MRRLVRLSALVVSGLLFSAAQCTDGSKGAKDVKQNKATSKNSAKSKKSGAQTESIGTATMKADGTLILDLRAKGEDGTIGDSRLVYPKDHKQYSEILKHIGGLKPGESKPVPPWPSKKEK